MTVPTLLISINTDVAHAVMGRLVAQNFSKMRMDNVCFGLRATACGRYCGGQCTNDQWSV